MSEELNKLALAWANGRHFRDVIADAYALGYNDALEGDMEPLADG